MGVGKEKFNLAHGSILGITHDFFNVLSFRPQSRHPSIKSAYFVGASAHPGTGVPIAIAGSRLCAEAVLSDLGIPTPECYTTQASFPIRKPTDELDKPQPSWMRHRLEKLPGGIWNHFAIMFLVTVILVLFKASETRLHMFQGAGTSSRKANIYPTTMEGKGEWTDHLPAVIPMVVGVLYFLYHIK